MLTRSQYGIACPAAPSEGSIIRKFLSPHINNIRLKQTINTFKLVLKEQGRPRGHLSIVLSKVI